MGIGSGSGAQLDNTALSRKSTLTCARRVVAGAAAALAIALALLAGSPADAGQAAVPRITQSPVGTLSELMVRIIYPSSDALFYITTRTPATEAEWNVVQGQALMVAESANLLMMPAHLRDEDRWLADARLMRDAGLAAFTAAKARDVAAVDAVNEALYQSCVTCHQHYRANYGRGR